MTADGNPCRHARPGGRAALSTHSTRHAEIGSEGFTILEILVAMVLVGFGVLGFAGLLKVMGNLEAEDTWATKALFCVQERMEEIKFACSTGQGFPTAGGEIVAEGAYQGMRREWRTGDAAAFEGLLEINVACAYPWEGGMKAFQVSTLVFPEE